jgi:hypothetical protein
MPATAASSFLLENSNMLLCRSRNALVKRLTAEKEYVWLLNESKGGIST